MKCWLCIRQPDFLFLPFSNYRSYLPFSWAGLDFPSWSLTCACSTCGTTEREGQCMLLICSLLHCWGLQQVIYMCQSAFRATALFQCADPAPSLLGLGSSLLPQLQSDPPWRLRCALHTRYCTVAELVSNLAYLFLSPRHLVGLNLN